MENSVNLVTPSGQLLKYLDAVDIALSAYFVNRTRPKNAVGCEVGVLFGGWSISLMLNSNAKIVGVDPYGWPQGANAKSELHRNLMDHNLETRFELLSSVDELKQFFQGDETEFCIAHIDGEHSEIATLSDLKALAPHMAVDGIIVVDDWCHPMFPGVHSALHQFMAASDYKMFAVTDRKAYLAASAVAGDLQDELVNDFLLREHYNWCWQHGREPSGPGGASVEMAAPELGAVAEYRIDSHVLGQRVALILGNRHSN
jgi:hypothetical protein